MLRMLDWALEEDLGRGDCTSNSSVPATLSHEGFILAKEAGVVAGIEVAREVFKRCLLYTSPSPRDGLLSRMPSSA